jgi:hypothetical protein
MHLLGINAFHGDSSACIIKDDARMVLYPGVIGKHIILKWFDKL